MNFYIACFLLITRYNCGENNRNSEVELGVCREAGTDVLAEDAGGMIMMILAYCCSGGGGTGMMSRPVMLIMRQ